VTLPSARPDLVKSRGPGCVYLASEWDVPVIQTLGQVLPGLNVWSSKDLTVGMGRLSGCPVQAKTVPADSPSFLKHLAASTLAIDLGGVDPALPSQAAEMGVPCLGLAELSQQQWLWPDLALESADTEKAILLGRRLLTDQGESAAACEQARCRLRTMSLASA